MQRDFLWGDLNNKSKFHLVNWKKVHTSLELGGLWMNSFLTFYLALLEKWLWRFDANRHAFWRQVMDKTMIVWLMVSGLTFSLGLMGWDFGNILGGVGMPSLVLLVLRGVTALIPRFGTMFGVGIILSRNLFQSYFSLQGIGMLWWLTLELFTMMWYIRALFFSNLCMIRRWVSFPHFSMFCILLGWARKVMIS